MKDNQRQTAIDYLIHADRAITVLMNKSLKWRTVRPFFCFVSNLGNGKFWYSLIVVIALTQGTLGLLAAGQMALTGIATLCIYKAVKGVTQRPRPGVVHSAILQGTSALDEYSFPSGHTMHAVMFTWIACAWFPGLLPPLALFTVLIAASRVVLGLHYPTDVVLGALFGLVIAKMSLWLVCP